MIVPFLSCLTNPSVLLSIPSTPVLLSFCKTKHPPVNLCSALSQPHFSDKLPPLLPDQHSLKFYAAALPHKPLSLKVTRSRCLGTPNSFPSFPFLILSASDIDAFPSLVKSAPWSELCLWPFPSVSLQALFFLLSLKCWFSSGLVSYARLISHGMKTLTPGPVTSALTLESRSLLSTSPLSQLSPKLRPSSSLQTCDSSSLCTLYRIPLLHLLIPGRAL